MTMRKLVLGALCAIPLIGCSPVQPVRIPAARPKVVTVVYGDPVPNLRPPTRLDIVLEGRDRSAATCADMGGKLSDRTGDAWVCRGVDY